MKAMPESAAHKILLKVFKSLRSRQLKKSKFDYHNALKLSRNFFEICNRVDGPFISGGFGFGAQIFYQYFIGVGLVRIVAGEAAKQAAAALVSGGFLA